MNIALSVVIFLTSFMLLKGSEFLCMVLIRIVFLVLINLVRLSFKVSRFQGFLFAMITYNVSDLSKKIQKIVKKARKPIKKL